MVRRNGGFIGTDGLDAPDPPTGVAASGVATSLSVSFTAPTDAGTSAITGFRAQASGVGTSGTSSPLVITGLTEATEVSVSVWAINAYGYSAPSAPILATPAAGRGIFAGGENASGTLLNVIEFITVSSTGNATDFGDLVTPTRRSAAFSSSTRGVIAGGRGSGVHNVIQYITIASAGDSLDFGDLVAAKEHVAGFSNSTRGVIGGGGTSETNVIQFVTIDTTGNATDFGDLSAARKNGGGLASTTRGVFCGGNEDAGDVDTMEYVTIASAGNATDFGNLSSARGFIMEGCTSNNTRGIICGGDSSGLVDIIEYITIANTGNATDFGDLSSVRQGTAAITSGNRSVIGGGQGANTSDARNIMEFVDISSTGNVTDFGDLSNNQTELCGVSNSHGGL